MSAVQIQGSASGTGTLTIAAPNTNTNRTLTLPDATGTLLSSATTIGFPAGSVLQVVNATYSVETSNSTSTYADTGLTATITPTSATSKILVFVSQCGLAKGNNEGVRLRLLRGATTIVQVEIAAAFTNTTTTNRVGGSSATFLDSPATTSATIYKTTFASSDNTAFATVQASTATSTISLMEIAA